jgi:alpha-L-rhamnosidase
MFRPSLVWMILLAAVPAVSAADLLQPVDLRCEYRQNPLGIDAVQPRLSWNLQVADPEARGQMQTAYQILAASSKDLLTSGQGDLWDTGKVQSDKSIQIKYDGKPLTSRMQAWWKVRAWNNADRPSSWSSPALWSMGLLQPQDWKGKWIGLDGGEGKPLALEHAHWLWSSQPGLGARYFRRTLEVETGDPVSDAVVFMVSTGDATLYVNGKSVGRASGMKEAVSTDITESLHPGKNVLAVAVTATGNDAAGLIGDVEMEFAKADPAVVTTDGQWRVSQAEVQGWNGERFDSSGWAPAKVLGSYGMEPWGDVGWAERRVLPARMLRKEFQVSGDVKRATLYISGLGLSEAYLNGEKIGQDVLVPALSNYDKRVFYLTYDVTDRLKPGANAIGVILGNGRYFAPRLKIPIGTRTFGYPKLRLQLEVEDGAGQVQQVVSDSTWKLTTEGPIRNSNEYDGEIYDARLEISDWSRAGADDFSWQRAQEVDGPKGVLAAQMIEPIRVTETLKPVKITQPKAGVYIFDMGQNMVGWCRLTVSGPRGTKVTLRHAERLREDGTLYVDNLRSAQATDTYVLSGKGTETYQPRFTYHGFRYVEVKGFPGKPTLAAIEGEEVHDAVEQHADFATSSPLINQIYKSVVWGTKDNYRSMPTDCPQRDERQGWLGDRAEESRGEPYMFDVAALYEKWVDDIADSQEEDGKLSDVSPNYWQLYSENVTWPSAFIIIPGHVYEQYGDLLPIETHYDDMKRWIAHMNTFLKDGVMPRDTYGDWCVPPESPELIHSQDPARKTAAPVLGTTYFYHLLRLMARYATLLKKPEDAKNFSDQADQLQAAFNKKFFNETTSTYSNGSPTSSVLPLAFGMVPETNRQRALDALIAKTNNQDRGHIGTGLIGGQWLMQVLSDSGHADVAYNVASQTTYPSWGYMVSQDATTIWELWNGNTANPAMNSGNHLMLVGDLITWFYENLAGIRPDPEQPGFKHIIMRPTPVGDLTLVKASHRSPYGEIASEWKRDSDRFTWDATVPPNTTATVYVPARDASSVWESGKAPDQTSGVKYLRMERGAAVYEVRSGKYHFESRPAQHATQ